MRCLADTVVERAIKLHTLHLEGCSCTPQGAAVIAEMLRSVHLNITSLILISNPLGFGGVRSLARTLTSLTLGSTEAPVNTVKKAGGTVLREMLDSNTTLTFLDASENCVNAETCRAIACALQKPTCVVTSLRLANNAFDAEAALQLSLMLRINTTLTSLDATGACLGLDGTRAFTYALKRSNVTLKVLNLSYQILPFGDDCAEAVAEMLEENVGLTDLILDGNSICDRGCAALSMALHKNRTLKRLSLVKNGHSEAGKHIGDTSAVAMATMLRVNTSLFCLDLSGNRIGELGGATFWRALAHGHPSLVELRLADQHSDRDSSSEVSVCGHLSVILCKPNTR